MDTTPKYELSVVATVYNDQATVPVLVEQLLAAIEPLDVSFEIILVNDASSDESEAAIEAACLEHPAVKGVTLSRNFGQQIAVSAGMREAAGRHVLIMDGDLQNPPSAIPELYRQIKKGYDIVYTRSSRRNNGLDELTSKVFWFIVSRLLGAKLVPNQLMMKIMSADFVEKFNSYGEANRVVAGITEDIGMSYDVLEVENKRRHSGKSHYSFFSRFELFLDIVLALSNKPLNALIYIGGIGSVFFLLLTLNHLVKYFIYDVVPGFTSIIVSICLFGSLNIAMLGIIGRYLSNIYVEVRGRPLFFIKKRFNL